jgi:hypothetical protein
MLDPNDIHIDNLAFFNQIRTNILALSPVKKIEDMILLKTLKKEIMQQ